MQLSNKVSAPHSTAVQMPSARMEGDGLRSWRVSNVYIYFPPKDAKNQTNNNNNKMRPGEARNILKAKEPEPGPPNFHLWALSIHPAPLSRERSELGIFAPNIILGNFNQASIFPGWGFNEAQGNFPEMTSNRLLANSVNAAHLFTF